MTVEIFEARPTISPAARDLLEALARSPIAREPAEIRDTLGRGWPNVRKRAALLGLLRRASLVYVVPQRGQRNADRRYGATRAGRLLVDCCPHGTLSLCPQCSGAA